MFISQTSEEDVFDELKKVAETSLELQNLSTIKDNLSAFQERLEKIPGAASRVISDDLAHVIGSRTLERARYYLKSILRDINSSRSYHEDEFIVDLWKGYEEIRTDSLWILGRRSNAAGQKAWYWGNFVPQIPQQLMMRYTRRGSWVLDPFCGSGTTLIQAALMGRKALGIELNADVFSRARSSITQMPNSGSDILMINADSSTIDLNDEMNKFGIPGFDLEILHPPYWNIIKFSDSSSDLSNAATLDEFISKFSAIALKSVDALNPGGHIALVIGDAYRDGEVIPLGFRCMSVMTDMGLRTKGIIVKDIQNTRGKRNSENLWRYRALKSGFYVFKHEYVFVFQKRQ